MESSSSLTTWIADVALRSGCRLTSEDMSAIDHQVYDPETDDGLETHLGAIFKILGSAATRSRRQLFDEPRH
jgi:hypothetical protein